MALLLSHQPFGCFIELTDDLISRIVDLLEPTQERASFSKGLGVFLLHSSQGLLDGLPQTIFDVSAQDLDRRLLRVDQHCFGCTAGAGST